MQWTVELAFHLWVTSKRSIEILIFLNHKPTVHFGLIRMQLK